LLKPLAIAKAALAEKMRLYFSTVVFLWSREKRAGTAFVFNIKTTGAVALGQSQSQKGGQMLLRAC
jgi:hypothetical protein